MSDEIKPQRVPLLPLTDLVAFPRTTVKLHLHEPRYRRLVRDLLERKEGERRLGVVLVKPSARRAGGEGSRAIYPGGTMAHLTEVSPLPDGRSNVLLEGVERFRIRFEVGDAPYREALVEAVEESPFDEGSVEVRRLRARLLATAGSLREELGEAFDLDRADLEELGLQRGFEETVNGLAHRLELPSERKLDLLTASLPERAEQLLELLEGQRHTLDLLRPFRPMAAHPEQN